MKTLKCDRQNQKNIESQSKIVALTKPDLPPLENYIEYLKKIWQNRFLTNDSEFVQLLQEELITYLKVGNLALVSNGTLALHIALKACEIEGEVITTPFTYATTTNVLLWEGIIPVFADIDPKTFNIDPEEVEKRITEKSRAILAVHVYGNPCYIEKLQEIANKYNLKLIYDAAHAFGVEYKGQSILSFGDVSTVSFHATKVFNTIEGGAVICKDKNLLEKMKLLRNHGIKSEGEVLIPGTNAKMDEFHAAMGLCNLKIIDERILQRKRIYEHYRQKLSEYVQFQKIIATRYNYGYMPVCFQDNKERDRVYSDLIIHGIQPKKYFFPLTTNNDYFKKVDLVKRYNLTQAFDVSNRVLCLPIYPDLKIGTVNKIVEIIKTSL